VRRLNDLADLELVFKGNDLGPDMTTGSRGLLKSVDRGESGHHVGMRGDEDPQADPGNLRPGVYEGNVFIRAEVLPDPARCYALPEQQFPGASRRLSRVGVLSASGRLGCVYDVLRIGSSNVVGHHRSANRPDRTAAASSVSETMR
jgi:hypothetical protein